jgi:ribosomal subunit interface protein
METQNPDALFAIDFQSDTERFSQRMQDKVSQRLSKLAHGHTDLTGAAVHVHTASGDSQPEQFRVRVVLFRRPNNIAGERTDERVSAALDGALSAVTKQVRKERDRHRDAKRR